jgi:sporulation protein YlmC with PRC-barrel domain
MLKIKKVSETIGRKVYTDTGDYFGEIEEANLIENKIDSWRIRIANSMGNFLGGARGVIIPHQFVKAVGDIVVVSRASLPLEEGEETVEQTVDLSAEGGGSDEVTEVTLV